ncbi:hypothetical protein G7Y79_00013g034130 [Physcia stellaris]|nr:hypothetical protein G7Y79_00013g034130 [Physcia stellaris]
MTENFCKLSRAYETLCDTQARRTYDAQWVHIRHYQSTQREEERRQAEKAAAERKKAAEEFLNHQAQQRKLQERLQPLEKLRSQHEGSIFETNRVIRRLAAELKRIQDLDEEELRKQNERNSWWTYFTSPVYGKAQESEGEKQKREIERLQRLATKSIKGFELQQMEAKLKIFENALKDTAQKIVAERTKHETERQAQRAKEEQARKEADATRRAYEQMLRDRLAKLAVEQARLRREQAREEELRAAKEAREAEEARERARVAREAELTQRRERARASREEATREAQVRAARRTKEARMRTQPGTCQHKAFWPKIDGRHVCSKCHKKQNLFAFQCPGCNIIACAPCRQDARNEKGGFTRNKDRQYWEDLG